ncbi:MAG TPA: SgcJ/EcaC family oxidoreductase [Candidatus Cybelea sp.]|nr:SgcJ/EcaC family oxidoreductase [Candidatus Cybelea sp.]
MTDANDIKSIEEIGARWQAAWNRHDMRSLGALVEEDVDFVNVRGVRLKGRDDFERFHAKAHALLFKNSVWRTSATDVRFLSKDVCVAHVRWSMSGDTDPDGTQRPPRDGIFTWVLQRHGPAWLIAAAHNTTINLDKTVS